jgi:multidrug efflux system outer membrane protein
VSEVCEVRKARACVVLCLLAGCSLEPSYVRPKAPVPKHWPSGEAYAAPSGEYHALRWQALFVDPQLRAVIDLSLRQNRDLRVAAADIIAARAQYGLARAAIWPSIGAGAGATLINTVDTKLSQYFELGIGTTAFELDVFGKQRSLAHAAQENYLATREGARMLRLTLISDTAAAWLNLAAQHSLLAIAQDTERNADESVRLTQSRFEGGVASELDVRQAETILAQARSDVSAYKTSLAQAQNALTLLAGHELAVAQLPSALGDGASLLAEVPAGISSHVLLRRPDVVQAEHGLKAAHANIGAARAAFFPTLSLTALGGLITDALSTLVSLGAAGWRFDPSISIPIFTGGANEARLEYARALRTRSVAEYERVIQRAFREVADALARRGTIESQLAAQRALVAASEASYQLSDARYRAGAASYLNALDAQRTLYAARRTLVITQLTRAENLVTLYSVLGGG